MIYEFKERDITDHPTEILNDNIADEIHEGYMNSDQFEFIDEKFDDKENTQDDSNLIIDNPIPNYIEHNTIEENNPIKVTFTGDNITITFSNITKKTFECDVCKKTFTQARYLRRHSKIHTIHEYKCEYCNFSTNYKYRYNEHLYIHTNTFIYSCSKCVYKSNIKRNFNKHCNRHENNISDVKNKKGYNDMYFSAPKHCDECEFETCSRKNYSRHLLQHKSKIHKCDHCDYSNHSKYNVSRHISRKHKN